MPNPAEMKTALQAYIEAFNSVNVSAVVALYADDATVEDPVGTPVKRGRDEITAFYRDAIATGAQLELLAPIVGSHGNSAAMAFRAVVGALTIHIVDVMTFNSAGKFATMQAFWGPDDMRRVSGS